MEAAVSEALALQVLLHLPLLLHRLHLLLLRLLLHRARVKALLRPDCT